jgi:hypothetical protein
MEDHLGWVHGSNMPSVYIHMSGKQVDDALLKMYGIRKEEDCQPQLTPIKCPRCKQMNGPTARYCSSCRMALTMEAAHNIEDDENAVMELLKGYIKNHPEKFEELL